MDFTDEQVTRYSRHILLPEVGGKGQRKIANAKILLVGAGGGPRAVVLDQEPLRRLSHRGRGRRGIAGQQLREEAGVLFSVHAEP